MSSIIIIKYLLTNVLNYKALEYLSRYLLLVQ